MPENVASRRVMEEVGLRETARFVFPARALPGLTLPEVPGVAFTASGGISSEAELLELKEMGTAAAILGKSLYTGALDLERCVQLVQD